ncbi:FAD-dependent oxidoreductase [Algoriphagus litoralis]|uniref:FAD-dependent oxidoreductase n=1 Tax=Algoriphagus litoralis TaxID=2202829 RepID=UPI00130062D3|nr:FAD-dependent oxidoreductase [Algoriphagus litoralis]
MSTKNQRIAILGAGGLGACVALELSQRGYKVDLYEEHSAPLKKASYANEGKVHVGFIYAMDKSFHTANSMLIGAVHFMEYLQRWVDVKPEEMISSPFYYLVHKGSLLNATELNAHYQKCCQVFAELSGGGKKKYLGLFDSLEAKLLPKSKMQDIGNPEFIDDIFETTEYAVDPRYIAEKLTEAILSDPNINLILNTKVEAVAKVKERLKVISRNAGLQIEEEYSDVINATWNGLLEIDRTMGIEPLGKWSHRYKFANKILVPLEKQDLPSTTIVLGAFGDTVNFLERGVFMSWYPVGRTGWSEDYRPPDWDTIYSEDERMDVFQRSFEALKERVPALGNLKFPLEAVDPVGGDILALGTVDVDKNESRLHERFEVGIRSFGNYHTVDTGKYTIIPYLAMKVADRLEGKG